MPFCSSPAVHSPHYQTNLDTLSIPKGKEKSPLIIFYRTPLLRVLADTNGVIEGAATLSGNIVIDDLKVALEEIFGNYKRGYGYE